jgi:NADH:ubiquinone oxidoreductase subunit D
MYNKVEFDEITYNAGDCFDRYMVPLYKQASFKPYIIAAMIFLSKVKDPVSALMALDAAGKRKFF